jgi:uncharacterized protein YbaP (TraB family)
VNWYTSRMIRLPRPTWRAALFFAFVTSLATGATGFAQAPAGKNFLWKVQNGRGVLYIAGSVHALSADVYPLSDAYQRAFDASDTLVEEIDLSEADLFTAAPMLLTKGMYLDGRTFNQAVSKDTAAMVQARLTGTPFSLELIQSMKPWMVMLMLSAMQVQQAGLEASLGLDKHFYDRARTAGKTVIGLETAESQVDRFDKMPEILQEQLLRTTLSELDTAQKELGTIVSAWRRGDAAVLERTLLSGFVKYPAAYNSLIVERNRNWIPQIDRCLARSRPCFVVVGAAHLVGPDGLLKMLQQKGYRLEQL